MRNIKIISILFLVFAIATSCKNDDETTDVTADLIGEWHRSDASADFEYALIFNADNTGFRTEYERDADMNEISTIVMFVWDVDGDILTLNFDGDIITTAFSIDANGYLYLDDFTELYFSKL